jgi:hypothetical protein
VVQALVAPALCAADEIKVAQAQIEASEDGHRLSAAYSLELNRELEDALERGIPLYFTVEVHVTRPRRYWFDESTLDTSQTYRISYNVLTRQYRAGVNGSLQRSFNTLEDALAVIRSPGRWVIAEKGMLRPGETYSAAIRMALDVAHLPKPFQVNALNNSDWRLSSDWKQFLFKAEAP